MEAHFVLPRAAILFCGFPVCPWADQTDVDGQPGKLAYVAEHTHRAARAQAQGKATNFLIYSFSQPRHRTLSVQSVKSVVEKKAPSVVESGRKKEPLRGRYNTYQTQNFPSVINKRIIY